MSDLPPLIVPLIASVREHVAKPERLPTPLWPKWPGRLRFYACGRSPLGMIDGSAYRSPTAEKAAKIWGFRREVCQRFIEWWDSLLDPKQAVEVVWSMALPVPPPLPTLSIPKRESVVDKIRQKLYGESR